MPASMTMTKNILLDCKRMLFPLLLIVGLVAQVTNAKTVSGDFRLSGLTTEYVLGSFAVDAKHEGTMTVELISKDGPFSEFKARLYRDDVWPKFKKSLICDEKTSYATVTEPVSFSRDHLHPKKQVATVAMKMDNTKEDRPHYYYFVIDDCSLEMFMHDDRVPRIHYRLQTWDDGSHLSADETHLMNLHMVTMICSGILATLMGLTIMMQLLKRSAVHAAMFLVMAAAACDSGSSICEIIHLKAYILDGIGSYVFDALSAHLEAMCDSLIALMLLFVASGWTLPSDVVAVQQNATMVQKVIGGLQNPFRALMNRSPGAIFGVFIIAAHMILAQWGRTYNDDFDSYHDLEHLPGNILMMLRIFLGLCLIICCFQTRSRCPISLHGFYVKLAIVGTLWFQSLPAVIWLCNLLIPYHLRHVAVGKWCAVTQTTSILLLSWLVTSHSKSAYHKFSHMSSTKEDFTESLSSKSTGAESGFSFKMGNSKVRLD